LAGLISPALLVAQKTADKKITVYYFHGLRRCPSCLAIEKEAKAVVTQELKDLEKNGSLAYESINIELKKNEAIAKKYDIWGSSLILVDKNGKKIDFTEQGFQYARSKPQEFRKLLKERIQTELK
jgi:hypothetical protein